MKLRIADLYMDVACEEHVISCLPNLRPFLVQDGEEVADVSLICRVETGMHLSQEKATPVLTSVLEGRIMRLWLMADCCSLSLTFPDSGRTYRLQADRRWKSVKTDWEPDVAESFVALNDFIMVAFVYSSAFWDTSLIHASCVAIGEEGCAFIGPSGIGKSTHSRLWQQYIPGARLLNDDQPVLRLKADGTVSMYGSPWSGKTACYCNEEVRLKGLFFMEQASENQIVRLSGVEAFQHLLKATSLIGRDTVTFEAISGTQARIAGLIPAFRFKNHPHKDAAYLSYQAFMSM